MLSNLYERFPPSLSSALPPFFNIQGKLWFRCVYEGNNDDDDEIKIQHPKATYYNQIWKVQKCEVWGKEKTWHYDKMLCKSRNFNCVSSSQASKRNREGRKVGWVSRVAEWAAWGSLSSVWPSHRPKLSIIITHSPLSSLHTALLSLPAWVTVGRAYGRFGRFYFRHRFWVKIMFTLRVFKGI